MDQSFSGINVLDLTKKLMNEFVDKFPELAKQYIIQIVGHSLDEWGRENLGRGGKEVRDALLSTDARNKRSEQQEPTEEKEDNESMSDDDESDDGRDLYAAYMNE